MRCTDVLTFHENDARKEDEYLLVHGRTFEIPIVQLELSICPRSSFGVLIAVLNFSNRMSTVEMDSYEGYIQ